MLEEDWTFYFDNQYDFAPYRKLLSRLNIIVGFGRGFWAGVDDYLRFLQDKLLLPGFCSYSFFFKNLNFTYSETLSVFNRSI